MTKPRYAPFAHWPLAISLVAVMAPSPAVQGADDVVIGMSAAFKGASRGLGIELYRGASAYFEEVNHAGGVHGQKIVLKAYDDGYNPGPAVENTIKLVEKDNALLLFGYVGTPTTTRVLPLLKRYEKRDVLLFFPFTGAETLRRLPYDPFAYNLRASYTQETAGLVDHFVGIGCKRIAVFYQIDAYGRSGWEGVRKALNQHDLRMAGEATYRRGTAFKENMSEQVRILRDAEPDAIISIGAYSACAAFIRDARDAGLDVPIANVSFVGSESLLSLLTEAGAGDANKYTKKLINSQVVPSYYDEELPAVRSYQAAMKEFKPAPPAVADAEGYVLQNMGYVSFEGYLDAKLLTEILRHAEAPLSRDKLRAAAARVENFNLGIGIPVSFQKDGSPVYQALNQVYFTVVRDGRFVTLPEEGWKEWRK